jgi:hypothetical protein
MEAIQFPASGAYLCSEAFSDPSIILKPSLMKTKGIINLLLVAVAGAVFTGCPPSPDPDPEISLLDPTEVTENGFTVHWTVLHATPVEVHLELCCTPDFNEIFKEAAIDDPAKTHYRFEGLHGATRYYCRIRITTSDGDTPSKTSMFKTGYQSENADVITQDGLHIAGNLYYLSSNPPESPAMILMGHAQINNFWKGEDLFMDLVAEGYICYIFSWRGHGQSEYWPIPPNPSCEYLEEFASTYAFMDMEACYTYLKAHEKVDSTRIGLMGGSLGAIESLNGNNWTGVKVSVALTAVRTGLREMDLLQNVLLTGGKGDYISTCDYWIADECTAIYNAAVEPKKLILLEGDKHGIDILAVKGIKKEILDWINARMAD